MSKKRRQIKSRDAPTQQKQQGVLLCNPDAWEILCGDKYKPILSCNEVQTCLNVYAETIASMTIQLFEQTDEGAVRIRDALSRKIDIEPHHNMIRHTWMSNLVRVMLAKGNQITRPHYNGDLLDDLEPIAPTRVSFQHDGGCEYHILIDGVRYSPEELLHFVHNPDPERPYMGRGLELSMRDVVDSLRQSNATKNNLIKSPMPAVLIKVDGYDEKLKSPEGRSKIARQFVTAEKSGEPWVYAADSFEVTTVKPMTLTDLAIDKNIEMDKRAVASMMGIPPFLVGVGPFRLEEYQWWVATKAMPVAQIVQQTLTKGLIYSPDRFLRMSNWSLLNYDLTKVNNVCSTMVQANAMRRNEWRDKVGMPPDPAMNDMLVLENYLRVNQMQQNNPDPAGGDNGEG